jgi:hypothetical protein
MARFAYQILFSLGDSYWPNGLWLFLSVGAIALFGVFIPVVTWIDSRRKEREAFYKAETFRRMAESSGEGAKSAVEMLREEERIKQVKVREGLKIAGLINVATGLALVIFLHGLLPGSGAVYLCGLIPGFIGLAMLTYVYFLAEPVH